MPGLITGGLVFSEYFIPAFVGALLHVLAAITCPLFEGIGIGKFRAIICATGFLFRSSDILTNPSDWDPVSEDINYLLPLVAERNIS